MAQVVKSDRDEERGDSEEKNKNTKAIAVFIGPFYEKREEESPRQKFRGRILP